MKLTSLEDLFVSELRDLYSAEQQILKALPKMAKAARSKELKTAFDDHYKETKGQVDRLDRIFKALGEPPKGRKCEAMEGLLSEGEDLIAEGADPSVLDAGLISAAQKVEHYEIAGYGCVRTYAEMLGYEGAAELLNKTEQEEGNADKKLTELAKTIINVEASRAPYASARTGARFGARYSDVRHEGGGVGGFLLGLGIGTGAAMLMAPKSGQETREQLRNKANEGKDYVKRRSAELRETAEDMVQRGRDLMGQQRTSQPDEIRR